MPDIFIWPKRNFPVQNYVPMFKKNVTGNVRVQGADLAPPFKLSCAILAHCLTIDFMQHSETFRLVKTVAVCLGHRADHDP